MSYSLKEPQLDDLRFQTLVDEARKRIVSYCPEWTEYNVSDPGITLIELFAYMTEALGYRLNQVPRKNYIKFLELLSTAPEPPRPAKTDLTFYLSAPIPFTLATGVPDFTTRITIPGSTTQVGSRRSTIQDNEIVFTTDRDLVIAPVELVHVRRDIEGDFDQNYLKQKEKDETVYYVFRSKIFNAFRSQSKPQQGDTFYLGFESDHDIRGYLIRLEFDLRQAEGSGVNPDNPPLIWACYTSEGEWKPIRPDEDTTLGLNTSGHVILPLPLTIQPTEVHGINAYWVSCRLHIKNQSVQGDYEKSPSIKNIQAYTIGATVPATHSVTYMGRVLGESNGEPGQTFVLPHAPILPLRTDWGEMIEVEEGASQDLGFRPWQQVHDFSKSDRFDYHYTLDVATGEIAFGPSIRQPNGEAKQYGRVPPLNRRIRVTKYRQGGGAVGNVPANVLQVLKQSISYVTEVTNRRSAFGGQDEESIDQAIIKTQRALQTAQRAVTAADYEYLTLQHIKAVARVKCKSPGDGTIALGTVKLLVVPTVTLEANPEAIEIEEDNRPKSEEEQLLLEKRRAYEFIAKLTVQPDLVEHVQDVLKNYRILGTSLDIGQPTYRALKININVIHQPYKQKRAVQTAITEMLGRFITPVKLASSKTHLETYHAPVASLAQEGVEPWPFGHNLYLSELYTRVQTVDGVKHVTRLEMWSAEIKPELVKKSLDSGQLPAEPRWEAATSGTVFVKSDTLLCLLECNITFEA